jgi:hypothetical protein
MTTTSTEERIEQYLQRFENLKEIRQRMDAICLDVAEYVCPSRGRFPGDDPKPDRQHGRRGSKIIDSTAQDCHEIASNGLHSGLTPPSRPWFKLAFSSDVLNTLGSGTRKWLDHLADTVRSALRKSNFYQVIHMSYAEIVAFSNSCIRMDSGKGGLRFRCETWGTYWIAVDENGTVDTLYREEELSARQILRRWGESEKWRNVVEAHKRNPYQTYRVLHVVQPRKDRDVEKIDKKNKPWESVWILLDGERAILEESGFDSFRFAVGRWTVSGCDWYGDDAPGCKKLPDIKQLQDMEETTTVASHRGADPPLVAPSGMAKRVIRKSPGGITYLDSASNHEALRPLYQVNFDLAHAENKSESIRTRIRKGFYNDLFLAITALEQQVGNVTATQIIQMQQEKLLQLGPFIERQEAEVLDKLLEWVVLEIVTNPERYDLEPPPGNIDLLDYRIEYVSLLAMAQQVSAVKALDEMVQTAGAWASVFPGVLDNVDADEAYRARGLMTGAPAVMFRDQDVVAQLRKQRAEQQQQQAQAEQLQALAKSAKDVGSISMDSQNPNVVQQLLNEGLQSGVI